MDYKTLGPTRTPSILGVCESSHVIEIPSGVNMKLEMMLVGDLLKDLKNWIHASDFFESWQFHVPNVVNWFLWSDLIGETILQKVLMDFLLRSDDISGFKVNHEVTVATLLLTAVEWGCVWVMLCFS